MKKIIYISKVIMFLTIVGCQSTSSTTFQQIPDKKSLPNSYKLQKIAVVAIPHRQFEFPTSKVENMAMEDLIHKGYIISSRGDFNRVLSEQRIQKNQLTEIDAARLGQILNVDAIFIFELTDIEERKNPSGGKYISHVSIAGRLVDVEKAQVVWIENSSTEKVGLLEMVAMLPLNLLINPNEDRIEKKVKAILKQFPIREI